MTNTDLSSEIAAFMRQKPKLVADYGSSWVVFIGDVCRGHFALFEEAAKFAVANYGQEQFLIRHTTEPPPQIPLVFVDA